MRAAITLVNIHEDDTQQTGYRAVDLARVWQKHYPVPLSFVVPTTLFDEFLTQSGIAKKIIRIYGNHPETPDGYLKAYEELAGLFSQVQFSGPIKDELIEAYESLAIPGNGEADRLVAASEPRVLLYPSPTYLQTPEKVGLLQQSVTGAERFLDAIKHAWLSLYTPEAVIDRKQNSIGPFSTGIVVQQEVRKADTAVGTYTKREELPITITSHLGLPDQDATGDEHGLSYEHLMVKRTTVRQQGRKLVGNREGTKEVYLQQRGNEQKLTDKQVLEAGRLTKRVHVMLSCDVELLFRVKDEEVSVVYVLRKAARSDNTHPPAEETLAEEEESAEEPVEETYDPDQESLGLDEPAEEPYNEGDFAPTEGTPIMVVDEEPESIQTYDSAPESEPYDETEPSVAEREETPAVETYAEPAPEPQEAPFNSSEEPPQQKEETLFDLFTSETVEEEQAPPDPEGTAFLEETKTLINDALNEGGYVDAPQEEIDRLFASSTPDDQSIGLAWRLRSRIRK